MKHHLFIPEIIPVATLFVFAILFCGCSFSYSVRSMTDGEFNDKLKGKGAAIKLKDGKEVSAKEITISNDSVSWLGEGADEKSKAGIGDLNKIVIKNHALGALEGMGFGLLGGVASGIIGGWIIGESTLHTGGTTGGGPNLGGLLVFAGAVAGGTVLGVLIGAVSGHSYNYEFQSTTDTNAVVLYLKDGSNVNGTIISEIREGKTLIRITVRRLSGDIRTYDASEVEYIEKEK